jgi:hypothetical protein
MADLSGVPLSERDLFEKNEEMIRRLLDRQLELMELKEDLPKKDKIGRGKLQKEFGKINRWLGDLYQAPETYADINMEGVTNKQLGERIHAHTRRVMDKWALDTRPSGAGGSSIHHADSTMQTLGAVRTAPTGMRRDIIAAIKDQGKELATGLRGKNFFDVSEETHPLYHPGEGGKVDYKNRLAAIKDMPSTATFDERMAALKQSTNISTAASEAADASPLAQARQTKIIETIKLGGGEGLLDIEGNPFDRNIRTVESIAALRKPLKVGLSMQNGSFRLSFLPGAEEMIQAVVKNPFGAAVGAASMIEPEAVTSAMQGDYRQAVEQTAIGAGVGAGIQQALKVNPVQQARLASYASKIPGVVSRIPAVLKIGAAVAKIAPPVLAGVAGYQILNAIVEGATGNNLQKNLQKTGVAAEEKKEQLRKEGYSNYELRRRARTGYRRP